MLQTRYKIVKRVWDFLKEIFGMFGARSMYARSNPKFSFELSHKQKRASLSGKTVESSEFLQWPLRETVLKIAQAVDTSS